MEKQDIFEWKYKGTVRIIVFKESILNCYAQCFTII